MKCRWIGAAQYLPIPWFNEILSRHSVVLVGPLRVKDIVETVHVTVGWILIDELDSIVIGADVLRMVREERVREGGSSVWEGDLNADRDHLGFGNRCGHRAVTEIAPIRLTGDIAHRGLPVHSEDAVHGIRGIDPRNEDLGDLQPNVPDWCWIVGDRDLELLGIRVAGSVGYLNSESKGAYGGGPAAKRAVVG